MMADREKLIEICRRYDGTPPCDTCKKTIGNCSMCGLERLIDYLISEGVTVREPNTILTLHGYNAEALVLVAEMLRKRLITEDELDNFFKDFTKMYEVIIREQKTIIKEAMATFEWPSVGEVVEMMWNERNRKAIEAWNRRAEDDK